MPPKEPQLWTVNIACRAFANTIMPVQRRPSPSHSRSPPYRGMVMVKVVPCPSALSTVTWPRCAATISCTMYKPKPVPPGFVVYKGSKILAMLRLGDPTARIPDLELHVRRRPPPARVSVPPWGMASSAFCTRFSTARRNVAA